MGKQDPAHTNYRRNKITVPEFGDKYNENQELGKSLKH